MGFLDKAKAAASDLAAKADTALANSGLGGPGATASPEKLLRDLGVVAYLEATGRSAPEGEKERLMGTLRELEATNVLAPLVLHTTPPPPGAGSPPPGAVPPPPGGAPGMPTAGPPPPGGPAPAGTDGTPTTPAVVDEEGRGELSAPRRSHLAVEVLVVKVSSR